MLQEQKPQGPNEQGPLEEGNHSGMADVNKGKLLADKGANKGVVGAGRRTPQGG